MKENKGRPGFMLYYSDFAGIDDYSTEECGELFRAILQYATAGEVPSFSDRGMRQIWRTIREALDRDEQRYAEKVEANRLRGRYKAYTDHTINPLSFEEWKRVFVDEAAERIAALEKLKREVPKTASGTSAKTPSGPEVLKKSPAATGESPHTLPDPRQGTQTPPSPSQRPMTLPDPNRGPSTLPDPSERLRTQANASQIQTQLQKENQNQNQFQNQPQTQTRPGKGSPSSEPDEDMSEILRSLAEDARHIREASALRQASAPPAKGWRQTRYR